MTRWLLLSLLAVTGCGPAARGEPIDATPSIDSVDGQQQGCGALAQCYSVYAHSNDTLYVVDLLARTLQRIGDFNAPNGDTVTDLAVAPDDTIYVISRTKIYTASSIDGHVTQVGSLSACGSYGVALTTLPNGQIWTGDYSGKLCQIDMATDPPTVMPPVTMASGMALAGDLVAVADGTVYGTAYKLSDPTGQGSELDNLLVTIDLATGAVSQLGATGYPRLYGTSFADGHVIGFTHDGSGRVIQIDIATGIGTMYATFTDPQSQQPIAFAGAGVSSLVPVIL